MKKTLSLVLAIVLCFGMVCTFSGCKKEEPKEEPESSPTEVNLGGWLLTTPDGANIPENAKAAFDKATADMVGAKYTPIAYLGSQVVAGANYSYLCLVTTVTAQPVTKLVKVIVYNDLEGNASITDTIDVTLTDYIGKDESVDFSDQNLAGGWTPNTEFGSALPENVQTAFDKATAGLLGAKYNPIALLGSQVVAGSNYAVLCSLTTVTAEPASALAVVVIYADLEGNATITSATGFPVH